MSNTSAVAELAAWWARAEQTGAVDLQPDEPAWSSGLRRAYQHEIRMELDASRRELEAAAPALPDDGFRRVAHLLDLRRQLRSSRAEGIHEVILAFGAFIEQVPREEASTLGRAHHVRGTAQLRILELNSAEASLMRALALVTEEPARTWILDGIGQLLILLGAWHEARLVLDGVTERKRALGDALGVALTLGHLAQMELLLGAPARALEYVDQALPNAESLGQAMLLRLSTLGLQAALDASSTAQVGPDRVDAFVALVLQRVERVESAGLRADAALVLAQREHALSQPASTARWLERAQQDAGAPEQKARVAYYRRALGVDQRSADDWLAELAQITQATREVCEGEVRGLLMLAREAAKGGHQEDARRWAGRAFDRALTSNNRVWLRLVERVADEIDPLGLAERTVRRYTGRNLEDLERTVRTDVTIVFADLVGFSRMASAMTPEEVMSTARTVFELSSSVMTAHRVRPLTYLGDGLLAVAEGEGHSQRALTFALEFVRRSRDVSAVRKVLGVPHMLHSRAGVATGPVVMGVLGSLLKLEFSAIGHTTNVAARLQGRAEPDEVVAAYDVCGRVPPGACEEWLDLKGMEHEMHALRFRLG